MKLLSEWNVLSFKKILKYAVFAALLICLLYFKGVIDTKVIGFRIRFFTWYPFVYYIIFSNLIVGFSFGIPHILKQVKKEGEWRVNVEKLIIFVLPTIIIVISLFSFGQSLRFFYSFFSRIFDPSIYCIFLGFLIMTSLYKKETQINSLDKGKQKKRLRIGLISVIVGFILLLISLIELFMISRELPVLYWLGIISVPFLFIGIVCSLDILYSRYRSSDDLDAKISLH